MGFRSSHNRCHIECKSLAGSAQTVPKHLTSARDTSGARVSAAEGCRAAFRLTLCTQSHISNSGSQKEFLVKTEGFWRRKLPEVPQVSSLSVCVSDLKQACLYRNKVYMTKGIILYTLLQDAGNLQCFCGPFTSCH